MGLVGERQRQRGRRARACFHHSADPRARSEPVAPGGRDRHGQPGRPCPFPGRIVRRGRGLRRGALPADRRDRPRVLEAARRRGVRVFANMAVGYNNIDVAAASRLGILVTNTPGVLTEATADLTWALILAVARRVAEGDQEMRSGPVPGLGAVVHARRRRHGADARPDRAGPDRHGRGGAGPRVPDAAALSRPAGEPRARGPRAPGRSGSTSSWPRATSSACTSRSPPRPRI